jgi:hypothetical protein
MQARRKSFRNSRETRPPRLPYRRALWKKHKARWNRERRDRWHNDPKFRAQNKKACARYRKKNKKKLISKMRARYRKMKDAVLMAYGGKCKCCEITFLEFLAIHHVNGNGSKERKKLSPTGVFWKLYKALPKLLKGYEIMCHNCNGALGFFGYCPHQI